MVDRSGLLLLGAVLVPLFFPPGSMSAAAGGLETPADDDASSYTEIGVASWYGAQLQGRRTASGERFDMRKLTAAHKSLPLDTRVRVTNLRNGRSVEVTVNDRGPYVDARVIDLSARAAEALDLKRRGVGRVKIEVIDADDDAG